MGLRDDNFRLKDSLRIGKQSFFLVLIWLMEPPFLILRFFLSGYLPYLPRFDSAENATIPNWLTDVVEEIE